MSDNAPDLSVPRRVHVIGVGGAGMSAIATVLTAMGHSVTGSDLKASPVTQRLAAQGVKFSLGHRGEHIAEAEFVTYSPAVAADNPELRAAQEHGVAVFRRAEVLAAIAATRRCIAVAGTHGKTTTSSMLSLALVEAGLSPSFLIGADVNEIGTNAVWGRGEWLVLEADESYGTFQALSPEIALLTNVEEDHLDHYGTFGALRSAFGDYLRGASGAALVCADDPVAAALGTECGAASVGLSPGADYQMSDLVLGRSSVAFDLADHGEALGRLTAPVAGRHNALNAALAVVGALSAGCSFAAASAALARFVGVPRRLEFRGEANGVTFIDDYAHLPGEVRAALAAAAAGGWPRIVAVFQPHLYSRTVALAEDFGAAFDDADLVVITDIYGARERPVPGVSGRLVSDAITARHPNKPVRYAPSWRALVDTLSSVLTAGDLCLTMGAGDLTVLPDQLIAAPSW